MKLLPHQEKAAQQLRDKLSEYGMAILAGQPRSGKTLSFLDVVRDYDSPLIISQLKALPDIKKQAAAIGVNCEITNFHQVKNCVNNYDIIVIDEFHKYISGYPKRSAIWKEIKKLSGGIPIIFSSGTPSSEGYAKLFNPLSLSDHSPWRRYSRFTQWFVDYGKLYQMRMNGYMINKYDRTHESKILREIAPYTVSISREEAGHVHEATDELVKIPQSSEQILLYDILKRDMVIEEPEILADTPAKLMVKLHQISGGVVKTETGGHHYLDINPKLEWLKENIDPNNTVILAQYIEEQNILENHFPYTGSITKNAEGVDYSHIEHMIVFSMNFSASGYEQVRARQMNIFRDKPVHIKYLVSGIDEYVYKAVSAKKNFTASWYRRNG